jgi:SAM-dependent methyltransferase
VATVACPQCGAPRGLVAACAACGAQTPQVDGIPLFAPATRGGFDPRLFQELAEVEPTSFWFTARNRVIVWALATWFPDARTMLEVGCGTGYVLQAIASTFPALDLCAIDLHAEGLAFARQRVPHASFAQADARSLPFHEAFDVAGAFDVIEHVAQDEAIIASLKDSVRPGGGVILTVPQHPLLWSDFDNASHHVRRYRRGELERKVRALDLEVIASTSFVSLLLPLMTLSRLVRRPSRDRSVADELRHSSRVEAGLGFVSNLEYRLITAGMRLPVGGSRLIVARRRVQTL